MKRYILTLHDGRALLWEGDLDNLFYSEEGTNDTIFTTQPAEPKSNVFLRTPGGQMVSLDYVAVVDADPTSP